MKTGSALIASLSALFLTAIVPLRTLAQCQTDHLTPGVQWIYRALLDGNTLAVVGNGDSGWTAEVYAGQPGSWTLEATLPLPNDPVPTLVDGTLVIGAPYETIGEVYAAGKVLVFGRDAAGWSQVQEILPDALREMSLFGFAVAIEGDTLLIGEPGFFTSRPGRVHVYRQVAGAWVRESEIMASTSAVDFGSAVSLDGDRVAVAGAVEFLHYHTGEVFLFERASGSWSEILHLAPTELYEGDFGGVVVLEGATLAIRSVLGALAPHPAPPRRPCIYVFEEDAGGWTQSARLDSPTTGDYLWRQFSFAGGRLFVGAPFDGDVGVEGGKTYVFGGSSAGWSLSDELYGDDCDAGARFGWSVAASGGTVTIAAQATGVYLFEFDSECPHAAFAAAPLSGPAPLPVAFTDQSSGLVSQWTWALGDGGTSDLQHPSHTYTAPGTYTVDLVAGGPAGVDRAVRRDLVFVGTGASATVRNGTGFNPLRLASLSLPSIGGTWSAEIDTSAHPGATFGGLQGRARGLIGRMTPWGELLINHSSAHVFSRVGAPDAQGRVRFDFPLPDELALSGLQLSTQGGIIGGRGELLNAIDLVVGF